MVPIAGIVLIVPKEVSMRNYRFILQWFVAVMVGINLQACGSIQQALQGTSTFTPTVTLTPSPTLTATPTSTPTKTPTPTITPNVAATQQYEDFFSLVQNYHEAGQISSTEGESLELDNYEDSVATKLSYSWTETGVSAKNFIVRADFEWSNTINTTNLSGCGFVYRVQSNGDHYLIVLDAFDGVKLASSTDRGTYSMGPPRKGDVKTSDFGSGPYQATFTMIVNELKTHVYVNDDYYGEYTLLDFRITDSGPLAAAILSSGYGTRCKMTNVRAWIID